MFRMGPTNGLSIGFQDFPEMGSPKAFNAPLIPSSISIDPLSPVEILTIQLFDGHVQCLTLAQSFGDLGE